MATATVPKLPSVQQKWLSALNGKGSSKPNRCSGATEPLSQPDPSAPAPPGQEGRGPVGPGTGPASPPHPALIQGFVPAAPSLGAPSPPAEPPHPRWSDPSRHLLASHSTQCLPTKGQSALNSIPPYPGIWAWGGLELWLAPIRCPTHKVGAQIPMPPRPRAVKAAALTKICKCFHPSLAPGLQTVSQF